MPRTIEALLDDDPIVYGTDAWRSRNTGLYAYLRDHGRVDGRLLSARVEELLGEALIHDRNPAATDPQNAGHVRAQNENVLHYALSLGASPEVLTVALAAGFIHDLNKAVGAPLRQDRFAARGRDGRPLEAMRTLPESVALNHLGEATRAALARARAVGRGRLGSEAAAAIDACIVHHGLGSSLFIRRLLEGDNDWWGPALVDRRRGLRKVVHPPQPPTTLASVLHDLADSTQQMQGGAAWLFKYPHGYWRESGRSYGEMLSARGAAPGQGIALSLRDQLEVETWTCRQIVGQAHLDGLLDDRGHARLSKAVADATRRTRAWVDDERLREDAPSLYADVARGLGVSVRTARRRLHTIGPSSPGAAAIEPLLWASARRQDRLRTRDLARLIRRAR